MTPRLTRPEPEEFKPTSKRVDPAHEASAWFDYDAVDRALRTDAPPEELDNAHDALRKMLMWIVKHDPTTSETKRQVIGDRAIALTWILFPQLFDGLSLRAMSKAMGRPANHLAKLTGEASRFFGIESHGQSHAANRGTTGKRDAAADMGWASRPAFRKRIEKADRLVSDRDSVEPSMN